MESLEQKIAHLETLCQGYAPGTSLSRVLLDATLAQEHGLEVDPSAQSVVVWCLGIGTMLGQKVWAYGHTWEQAYEHVCQKLAAQQAKSKTRKSRKK